MHFQLRDENDSVVLNNEGKVATTFSYSTAVNLANEFKAETGSNCTVEKVEAVYTTSTLEDAIAGVKL